MKILILILGAGLMVLPAGLVHSWQGAAEIRLVEAEKAEEEGPQVAVAAHANESYCTPQLKKVLRRVLQSCGLIDSGGRGCQPADAKAVATMDDGDFNDLFVPMVKRGGIIQFDKSSIEMDTVDTALLDTIFADRRGASYFFVVSRASPEGSVLVNRDLSRGRAEAVMNHLQQTFNDPSLAEQVGLLWLGEEYAQLDPSFCSWNRSGADDSCLPEDLNRSAFVAWIDCTL